MKTGSYDEDWEVDFGKMEIRIRKATFVSRMRNWRKKYPLSTFHQYAHRMQASTEGIAFPSIFESDAMKPVKGVPKKIELVNGWSIPDKSRKKMVGDGYVLLGYGQLLVVEQRSSLWDAISLKPGVFGISIDLKKLFGRRP